MHDKYTLFLTLNGLMEAINHCFSNTIVKVWENLYILNVMSINKQIQIKQKFKYITV